MKVGFFHKVNTTPPRSGGSVHTYQVSRYLASCGYDLLTLDNEQGEQFTERFPRSISGIRALIKSADVLYFRIDGRSGWELLSLLPGLIPSKKPIIWEINATLEELHVLPGRVRLRDRLGRWLRPLAAKRAKAALCVSSPLLRYARDLGIHRAILSPNGSDPEMFKPQIDGDDTFSELGQSFRVLWAGSTEYPWHDFDLLLETAKFTQSIDQDISFIVMGKPPKLNQIEIPTNIHFYPAVPYLNAPKYFASADVGLCLYKPITWSRYGFFFSPLKLFDYGASGLPVLYSDIPALRAVAESFGAAIPLGSSEALVAKILELKNNLNTYQSLAMQARQSTCDFYNWERVGIQTELLLQAVIKQPELASSPAPAREASLKS